MLGIRRKLQRSTETVIDGRRLNVRVFADHLEMWQHRKRRRVRLDYATLWKEATREAQARLFP